MDDSNINMDEYIKLEEEKSRKREKVFNWETAKYGKIWYDEDVLDLRSVETEFPATIFNDSLTSYEIPSCEPTVCFLNDEIDFRISSDESDDEDYTENDNEKVNKPLFPSPELSFSCIDDLDFFKDFDNEFPAIVYNDALTSKLDFSTEPTLCPQHIDKFDLKYETLLSKYDEVEQSVLYFNDLFPFNIVYPDDQKSDKGNDENEIDMIQSSGGDDNTNKILEESHDKIRKVFIMGSFIMGLNVNIVAWNHFVNGMLFNLIKNFYVSFGILFDPKWYYKDGRARMLRRPRYVFFTLINLGKIDLQEWIRRIGVKPIQHMALPPRDQRHQYLRYEGLQYTDANIADFETKLARIFRREIHRGQRAYSGVLSYILVGEVVLNLDIIRDLHGDVGFGALLGEMCEVDPRQEGADEYYWIGISADGEISLALALSYTFYLGSDNRLCHRYLRLFALGRKQGVMIYGGKFVARLAKHFGLVTKEMLQGLTMIVRELSVINMAELVRLQIYEDIDDTCAWVASGLERQLDATAGAPRAAEDAPAADEGDQRMARLEEDMHEIRGALVEQREVIDVMARDFSRFTVWAAGGITQLLDSTGASYTSYSKTYIPYQRRVKRRTDAASTSVAQQDPQQRDL
ncbi:hypothetical protein Tco_0945806 [Tanacetum coccineum]